VPVLDPLLLVCTHASRDLCCALDGRPLAAGLAAQHGDQVWECSHVGGDRFAGNLVVLPYGEYHGWVDRDHGSAVAQASAVGQVLLARFRGRTSYDGWQQAAEIAVRERTGVLAREAVRCGPTHRNGGSGTVKVDSPAGRWRVEVERRTASPHAPSRCSAHLIPIEHVVTAIESLGPEAGGID
jgi:hypothetical protein